MSALANDAPVQDLPPLPQETARRTLTRAQARVFSGIALAGIVSLAIVPMPTLIVANTLATLFYFTYAAHRLWLVGSALGRPLELPAAPPLADSELPVYTVLVPLYHEGAVVSRLLAAIRALDYPPERLDVKLLLEADDGETRAAIARIELPPYVEIVDVPDGVPRTKPRACNFGLARARGELLVIYDAEDRPEPAQLRKVAALYHDADPSLACIQAKLNYYNPRQNLLTRWFTAEYSSWFDLLLPALDASAGPVPLGGTSNHFRSALLSEVGAWDPYNVTEDADLGVRLHRLGYRTGVVDSTTYEEANSRLGSWVNQRSRWIKGYIQTWLVHMRHPRAARRAVGTRAFLAFNLIVGGSVLGTLINPIYWAMIIVWIATESSTIQALFPAPVFYLGSLNLFVSSFAFIYVGVAGCLRRRNYWLVKWALLAYPYWVLMSGGAWKGLLQLVRRPHYWEKTQHGFFQLPEET